MNFRFFIFLYITLLLSETTHAYTQAWLPHQPIKQKEANQTSTNKSSSNAIGAGISLGAKETGINLNVSASRGKGNSDGHDTTYNNTQINAGNKLTLKSGGDTNLIGATAKANKIKADVGGDLTIQSLQDTSTYQSTQKNVGVSATVAIVGTGTGGSVNYSKSDINSTYKSVNQQSGLMAGDGGYDVDVKGDTTLTGGVIAASDKALADNNTSFKTGGKLTQTDLVNESAYSAKAVGVSASVGSTPSASGGVGSDSGHQQGVTKSGIGVSTASNTNGSIKPNFDAAKTTAEVNAQVQITQTFSQQAPKAVADFAGSQAKALRAEGKEDEAKKWDEGGSYRIALHTVSGALSGGATGAAGAATTASAAPLLDQLQTKVQETLIAQGISPDKAKTLSQGLAEMTSAGMGAAVGGTQGAITGMTVDTNNRQLHPEETQRIKNLAKGDAEKEARLTAAACALAHCADGVPTDDPAYSYLKGLQDAGENLTTEKNLLAAQTEWNGQGWDRLFQYSSVDKYVNDPMAQNKVGTRAGGVLQAFGGAVTTIGGAGIAAGGAITCPETGVGCLAAAGGTAMMGYGYDMTKAGTSTAYTGNATLTYGEQVLQSLGMNPQTAGITYALVGLSPAAAEAVAVNNAVNATTKYNTLARASYADFTTNGIKVTPEIMATPQAQALISEIKASNPAMSPELAQKYAENYISTGISLPQVGVATQGSPLIKVVPSGESVSATSGYWMSPEQARAIALMTPEQAGNALGIPAAQAATMLNKGVDFYAITAKPGTMPKVFVSNIAPTTQGAVTTVPIAQQVIVPNRNLWTTPKLVDPRTLKNK